MKKKKKSHFILGAVTGGDGETRITKGKRFLVCGGSKDTHEQTAECVQEIDRQLVKDPPQTPGEMRMIVREAAEKAGIVQPRDRSPER